MTCSPTYERSVTGGSRREGRRTLDLAKLGHDNLSEKWKKIEHVIRNGVGEARRQRDMWGVAGGRNMVPEQLTDEGGQGDDESA